MNAYKVSALLHYMGQIERRIGRDIQVAARFLRHGQRRTDKPSGAQRRKLLAWGGPYRYDAKAKVWRLYYRQGVIRETWQRLTRPTRQSIRVPRGSLSNPTALR